MINQHRNYTAVTFQTIQQLIFNGPRFRWSRLSARPGPSAEGTEKMGYKSFKKPSKKTPTTEWVVMMVNYWMKLLDETFSTKLVPKKSYIWAVRSRHNWSPVGHSGRFPCNSAEKATRNWGISEYHQQIGIAPERIPWRFSYQFLCKIALLNNPQFRLQVKCYLVLRHKNHWPVVTDCHFKDFLGRSWLRLESTVGNHLPLKRSCMESRAAAMVFSMIF